MLDLFSGANRGTSAELMLLVEEFLRARSLAPNSEKAYRLDLKRFILWSQQQGYPLSWAMVTPQQVGQFKADLLRGSEEMGRRRLADRSVQRTLHCLKSFYQWMQDTGYVTHNPTRSIQPPKPKQPQPNHLSVAQVQLVFEAALEIVPVERNMALLSILRHGLRASEVCGLNLGDYDGARLSIRSAKADSTGIVPIDAVGQAWINDYLSDRRQQGELLTPQSPLFVSHSRQNAGQRLGYHSIHKLMGRLSQAVGFGVQAHQFRHTYATHLVLSGMNPYHVMTLTRHKSPQTFRRYTQAADQQAAEVAFRAIEALNGLPNGVRSKLQSEPQSEPQPELQSEPQLELQWNVRSDRTSPDAPDQSGLP